MKNYHLLGLLCLLILPRVGFTQTTEGEGGLKKSNLDTIIGWKKGGLVSVGFSQTSLSNWAAGGQSSFSLNGLVSIFMNYKGKIAAWDNSLDLGYGILQQGLKNSPRKTDDKIDLTSKFGLKAMPAWYYAGLLNFKTQMTPGYNYPNNYTAISDFLAPGYILGALGMDHKPNAWFGFFISPATTKITLVNNQKLANTGAFGVEPAIYDATGKEINQGKNMRSEFGGYLRILLNKGDFKAVALKGLSINSRFDLFSNYLNNPENMDVNWEVILGMKVNQFISVNINTNLIYDHDIAIGIDQNGDEIPDQFGPKTQFKEIIGVGLMVKF